ncbi:MAG: hypothetical protein ACI4FV_05420 [Lachnospiraceae bacterium]
MNGDLDNRRKIIEQYKPDVQLLIRYIPWLEQKKDEQVVKEYGREEETVLTFPVYDSTLLALVKTAQKTCFMNRNYRYIYTRYGIHSVAKEIELIEHATLREMDLLGGILSRYVMGGMTKGSVWPEAVQNGVFLALFKKMQELVDITI